MRKYLIIGFVLIFVLKSYGQYFSTGEDPANLKWREISTLNFRLIYPDYFEQNAQILANYFEKVYLHGSETLTHNPRKISVIFHTHTVSSNGLVAWAPRRMEIFTPPHQSIYGQDWLEQLAIHEFRHVVQVDKIHSQMPLITKLLFGEQVSALVTGAFLPFWLIEGDAVIAETTFSNSGRGRLPSFLMEHKAQVVEKGVFSFDKAFNRSFRDYVPDHYKMGYLLAGEVRARYGPLLWNNGIDRVANPGFSLSPLNRSLKLQTAKNQQQLYTSIFDSLRRVWQEEDNRFMPVKSDTVKSAKTPFTNYRYNHILPSGEIVSLKSGFDMIPHFVKIKSNSEEEKIFTPGQIFDESVGYRENLIVWSEFIPDARWIHSGRSQIRIFDTENNHIHSFFPDYKCFAPDFSPDKHNVAVVEVDFQNNYYLTVYNAATGQVIKRYQTPDNNYLFSPVWKNSNEIVSVVLTDEGKQLALINPFDEKFEILGGNEMNEIKNLFVSDSFLYFIGGLTGKDELWKMNLETRETERLVPARFGLAYPALSSDRKRVLLSDYTAQGYQLIELQSDKLSAQPKGIFSPANYELADVLSSQDKGAIDFSGVDTLRYNSTPFRKGANLFKFHSWAPIAMDINSYDIKPGVTFMSQNLLGTSETTLGYQWNNSEKTGKYLAKFEYRGFYPIFSAEADLGKRAADYYDIKVYENSQGQVIREDTTVRRFTWNEQNLSLASRIPVNLTRGAWFRLFQPEIKYNLTSFKHGSNTPSGFIEGTMQTLAYRLYFHNIMRNAYRDLLPNWGIMADINYRHSPIGDIDVGSLTAGQIRTYIPGFIRNHGTTFYAGIQSRHKGQKTSFGDVIRMPRGWNSMQHKQLITTSAEYRLPLFYPDKNLGRWIYFRRVNASLFGDYARIQGDIYKDKEIIGEFSRNLSSVGADINIDVNFLRLYAPANIGFRTIYLPDLQDFNFEFLLSIDFTSF